MRLSNAPGASDCSGLPWRFLRILGWLFWCWHWRRTYRDFNLGYAAKAFWGRCVIKLPPRCLRCYGAPYELAAELTHSSRMLGERIFGTAVRPACEQCTERPRLTFKELVLSSSSPCWKKISGHYKCWCGSNLVQHCAPSNSGIGC